MGVTGGMDGMDTGRIIMEDVRVVVFNDVGMTKPVVVVVLMANNNHNHNVVNVVALLLDIMVENLGNTVCLLLLLRFCHWRWTGFVRFNFV
mmetsp:Transcript_27941/g.42806  ORF Transcript_27941/g.42806 Transcript_27941/m.42806 type:complete len:91 (+) Transcript_27941:548-820(+)